MVIKKGSGKDNGVIAFMENPAIMQEFIKRIKKRIIHRNKKIEFNYLGWLSYKTKIIIKISFIGFLIKSKPLFQTSSKNPN